MSETSTSTQESVTCSALSGVFLAGAVAVLP